MDWVSATAVMTALALGTEHRAQGDYQAAEQAFRSALAGNPTTGWLEIAVTRSWSGDLAGSIEAYDRVLALDPGHAAAQVGRYRVLSWQGHHRQARRGLEALPPDTPERTATLARVAQAQRQLARAQALDPDLDLGNDHRGQLALGLGGRSDGAVLGRASLSFEHGPWWTWRGEVSTQGAALHRPEQPVPWAVRAGGTLHRGPAWITPVVIAQPGGTGLDLDLALSGDAGTVGLAGWAQAGADGLASGGRLALGRGPLRLTGYLARVPDQGLSGAAVASIRATPGPWILTGAAGLTHQAAPLGQAGCSRALGRYRVGLEASIWTAPTVTAGLSLVVSTTLR